MTTKERRAHPFDWDNFYEGHRALTADEWRRIGARVAAALEQRGWPFPSKPPAAPQALGTGAYGAVYPTLHPGWVVKITEDASEGPLWQALMRDAMLAALPGFVAVGGVWRIRPQEAEYAILRERVSVGTPLKFHQIELLATVKGHAEKEEGKKWRSALKRLAKDAELRDVAEALHAFHERTGAMLEDIHVGNLGVREGSRSFVIFDVGGATDWDKLPDESAVANPEDGEP